MEYSEITLEEKRAFIDAFLKWVVANSSSLQSIHVIGHPKGLTLTEREQFLSDAYIIRGVLLVKLYIDSYPKREGIPDDLVKGLMRAFSLTTVKNLLKFNVMFSPEALQQINNMHKAYPHIDALFLTRAPNPSSFFPSATAAAAAADVEATASHKAAPSTKKKKSTLERLEEIKKFCDSIKKHVNRVADIDGPALSARLQEGVDEIARLIDGKAMSEKEKAKYVGAFKKNVASIRRHLKAFDSSKDKNSKETKQAVNDSLTQLQQLVDVMNSQRSSSRPHRK